MRSQSITALGTHHGAVMRRTDFYLAPTAPTADDAGPGTQDNPFRTLNGLLARLSQIVTVDPDAAVVCHLESGTYTWGRTLGPVALQGPIAIVGDGAGQPGDDGFTELQAAAAAAAGTGQFVVVDPAGGLTVNEFQGKTIEILSGNAAGDRRTIRNNTATDIVPALPFKAAVAQGDSFRIVEPAVTVRYGSGVGIGNGPIHIQGVGTPVFWEVGDLTLQDGYNFSSLLLVNMTWEEDGVQVATRFRAGNSMIFCAGVEFTEAANAAYNVARDCPIYAGIDALLAAVSGSGFQLPASLGLTGNKLDWFGWGLSMFEGPTYTVRAIKGALVFRSAQPNTEPVDASTWHLCGGALEGLAAATGIEALWQFGETSLVHLVAFDAANLPIRITADGGSDGSLALKAVGGARVICEGIEVILTGSGVGVGAGGNHITHPSPGVLELTKNNSITAPRVAVGVAHGGQVYVRDLPTLPAAPALAEVAVFQGRETSVPAASGTLAATLGATGDALVNPAQADGTLVMRVT